MENENITMLNALDINSTDCTIKVKIVKVWRRMMNEDQTKCYSIEMILMDEEGTKISATCLHKFFLRFEKYLIQDECLFIKRLSLAENRANFKLVTNQHKVTFYFSTSVRKCNVWAGPVHGFTFSDFKSVLGKSDNVEDNIAVGAVIDIIGYVMICYPIEDTVTKLGPGKRINLKLKNLYDDVVPVTLWDDFALEMNAYMSREDREKDVVLVIQFGALKLYQEKRTVSNAYHATKLFINSDIADIESFKKSYLDNFSSATSSSGEQSGSVMMTSIEDVFLHDTDFSPIAYVSLINEEKYVVIVATIKGICNKKLWYYESCNVCKCKVEKQFITVERPDGSCDVADKVFKCTNEKCIAEDINPIYRFKIPIIVQDSTGVTLFNREAFNFVKQSAEDLVVKQEKSTDFEEFPAEFDDFIGKRFAFSD